MTALLIWLQAFAWTLLIELPIALAVAPRGEDDDGEDRAWRWRRVLALGAAINLATHPLVTIVWFRAAESGDQTLALFLLMETAVVLVEALLWRIAAGWSWRRSALLALATNVPSAAASPLVAMWIIR
ncbi:MAG: hypothetical protein AB7K09_25230 [Planctomycetota bacterium]